MKVRIPLLIKDRMSTQAIDIEPTEGKIFENEPFFLDGPTSRRVSVLDFDADTGALQPGAKFLPPPGNGTGRYQIADEHDVESRDFNQVSVFGTVLKTMEMFEEEDTLGRRLTWAFQAPQLLVVPRAGEMANAFYERDSHSLQFFFFTDSDTQRGSTPVSRRISSPMRPVMRSSMASPRTCTTPSPRSPWPCTKPSRT